jgi:phosphoglycerate dehydrogenase-like enzyme
MGWAEGDRRVVLAGDHAATQHSRLTGALTTSWEVELVGEDAPPEVQRAAFAQADALVTVRHRDDVPPTPRLRLLQVPAAGYDQIGLALLPPGCILANSYAHEDGIAEYVMAGILHFTVELARQDRELRQRDWRSSHVVFGPLRRELGGATLGLIGVGHIGSAVALRAKAFGMRVVGTARRRQVPPRGVDALVSCDALLESADFVVLACPLNEETRGLIDAEALTRMKPHAVIVNVARGPVIDDRALFEALSAGRLRGAVLDVWYHYPTADDPRPMPSRYPFDTLDNVIMTPHTSGWTEPMMVNRWKGIAQNLDALARGEPLANVVHPRPEGPFA